MKIVIALGGNALGNNAEEQKEKVKAAARTIADLVKKGHKVVVSHGNGPQVGMISNAFSDTGMDMPFPECGAMSEGYIGYHLQNAISRLLKEESIDQDVVTIITRVLVDKDDAAFDDPSKPIGPFMDREAADELGKRHPEYVFKEIDGFGYRRVIASPKPVDIIEKKAIAELADGEHIVIACGGGGVPVIRDESGFLEGIAAVIDKDYASEKLAELLDADLLLILTAIDKVYIDFRKESRKALDRLSIADIDRYKEEGQFGQGSMLPKIEAARLFALYGKKTIIASLDNASEALDGRDGTAIGKD